MTSGQGKTYHRYDEGKKEQELALRQRLRLKWLPFGDGAKPEAIDLEVTAQVECAGGFCGAG